MNYDRIKDIFIDLYEELCETFDNFEYDFKEATSNGSTDNIDGISSKQISDTTAKLAYFEKITNSVEAANHFIKEVLAPIANTRSRFDVCNSYHQAVARETATSVIKVSRDPDVNYAAFKRKLAMNFKIYKKDIIELVKNMNNV